MPLICDMQVMLFYLVEFEIIYAKYLGTNNCAEPVSSPCKHFLRNRKSTAATYFYDFAPLPNFVLGKPFYVAVIAYELKTTARRK